MTTGDGKRWTRIAEGHYESGALMLWRLPDVNPPAWNVEDTATGELLVDGAATMRDAIALLPVRPDGWREHDEYYIADEHFPDPR